MGFAQGLPAWTRSAALLLTAALASQLAGVAGAQTGAAPPARVLHIAAAADLEPLLPEVLAQFEKAAGVHAEATFQSSATLAQQITNGAPFDLFLAADTGFPQGVIHAGLAMEAKPVVYARGTLVLWARRDAAVLHGKPLRLEALRDPSLQSVAIANPEHAPYGRAAKAAITSMGLDAALGTKLRVAANIAQAAEYADSGNAELGFLSLTGASTPRLRADGSYVAVPASSYPPILQGAVVLRHATDAADAEEFLQFLLSAPAQNLLKQRGLLPPP